MDPIQYWLLADDDDSEDFDVLSFVLREESGAAPPNLLLDWDNVFSEVDILDEYGYRRHYSTPCQLRRMMHKLPWLTCKDPVTPFRQFPKQSGMTA
jgi:hypothetical protein